MSARRGDSLSEGWNDARVEIAKAMWEVGKSASEIAAAVGHGLTRNAVIGKMHRIGQLRGPSVPNGARPRLVPAKPIFIGGAPPRFKRIQTAIPAIVAAAEPPSPPPATVAPPKVDPAPLAISAAHGKRVAPGAIHPRNIVGKAEGRKFDPGLPVLAASEATDLAPSEFACEPVTFAEMEPHHCRWPLGDPRSEDFRYCGARKSFRGPYCENHEKRAASVYQPSSKKYQEHALLR